MQEPSESWQQRHGAIPGRRGDQGHANQRQPEPDRSGERCQRHAADRIRRQRGKHGLGHRLEGDRLLDQTQCAENRDIDIERACKCRTRQQAAPAELSRQCGAGGGDDGKARR